MAEPTRAASSPKADWLRRCRERILEHDGSLGTTDVAELADALWDRPSCRALAPERAADLLFDGRLSSFGREEM